MVVMTKQQNPVYDLFQFGLINGCFRLIREHSNQEETIPLVTYL